LARKPPPKIALQKHETYRTIFQTGLFGGPRPGYFEWIIYTDEMVADDALGPIPPDPTKSYIKRTLQCSIMMTPIQAKNLVDLLGQQITQYEKTFGKIALPGKKGQKPPPSTMIT
jgi:hypothetical protein